ncbi:hypothetical protein AVEN_36243-1 [Araneus ventricosus]|uniref:Uncharacterized protein n=1 Tax=Araneus ventricosus TaxID=182803 RepID=A0A4Y2VF90_ARAVE|nr:hypothetical protein AVEN_192359-1 [Araneus ventricosus]GBO22330.1 hypothetical protein AVEN_36243-1 [Araneus ventricosus]
MFASDRVSLVLAISLPFGNHSGCFSRLIRKQCVTPLLWCPTAMLKGPIQPRSDVRWGQRHTYNRSSCEQSSFMQSALHSLEGYGLFCSSRELRRQLSRC